MKITDALKSYKGAILEGPIKLKIQYKITVLTVLYQFHESKLSDHTIFFRSF